MTICPKCKYRTICKTKTINAKTYCQYCGCIEHACHCKKPMLMKAKRSSITLTKEGDCKSCRYKAKCMKTNAWELCGYCGCLNEVCHCSLPKGQMETGKGYEVK